MPSNLRATRPKPAALWRVALILLLFFGALELFTRFKLVGMSKDLRRFKTYPARAAQLHAAPHLRVAVLGNSATERALDPRILKRELNAQGVATSLDIFTADASHLNTWDPMANHLFWSPKKAPDVLVVPFFNNSLDDANAIEVGRLAQFFTSTGEMPRVLHDLPDPGSRLEFLASSLCATCATRARLKERVLSLLVPDYQGFTAELNAAISPLAARKRAPAYHHLEQLARDARANGCRLIFVALPWRDKPYPVSFSLRSEAQKIGADFLDFHFTFTQTPQFFADSIHLNPQGRARFTPQFAHALAPLLRQKVPRESQLNQAAKSNGI